MKIISIKTVLLLLVVTSIITRAQEGSDLLNGKKILMIISPGDFRDEEYSEPKDYFENEGAIVVTGSTTLDEVEGMLGLKVVPDMLIKNVIVANYDAIIFVGGTGARGYYNNQEALRIAKQSVENNKVIAAICLAPNILCNAGILNDKKATAWSFEVSDCSVNKISKDVVRDGNIITANGPPAATAFAKEIGAALINTEGK